MGVQFMNDISTTIYFGKWFESNDIFSVGATSGAGMFIGTWCILMWVNVLRHSQNGSYTFGNCTLAHNQTWLLCIYLS